MNASVRRFTDIAVKLAIASRRVASDDEDTHTFATALSAVFRTARVYDVPRDVARTLHRDVQRHVCQVVADIPDVPEESEDADLTHIQLPMVVEKVSGEWSDLGSQDGLHPEKLRTALLDGRARASVLTRDGSALTANEVNTLLSEAREMLGMPEPLPFPAVFLGFGEGLRYSSGEANLRMEILHATYGAMHVLPTWRPERCVGLLFCRLVALDDGKPSPSVIEFVENDNDVIDMCPHYVGDIGWMPILGDCMPWWAHALIALINDAGRTRVVPVPALTYGERRARKKLCTSNPEVHPSDVPPPAPYYEVKLIDRAVARRRAEESVEAQTPIEVLWSHRWDVRAHDRMLVRRGALPMRTGAADLLRKRGYTVFEPDLGDVLAGKPLTLPPEEVQALTLRGFDLPTLGEWIAVRHVQVREHVRGPESAPYVPAARVVEAPGV